MARSTMTKRLTRWGMVFGVIALALLGVRLSGAAESLAYFPSRAPFETPAGFEDVWIEAEDGVRLHGWFMPASDPGDGQKPAVLHLHGNAGNISHHASFSRFLTRTGMHVLIIDYRCYGRSDEAGPLRREAVMRDARAALDVLRKRDDVDSARVGVLGVSLGGAFATKLAAEREEVRSLVTLSTFSTWSGVAGDMLPVLGPLLFPGGMDPIDNLEKLGERPYLIVHGASDGVIHARHADVLRERCEACELDARCVTIPGAGHNDIVASFPEASETIAGFFRETLGVE